MDERNAIARLKQGNIGGLETLVRTYQVQAIRTAYLICRDRALAEDIVQAAFLRVHQRIGQYDETRPFAPWFLRSVANDATKQAMRRQREVHVQSRDSESDEYGLSAHALLADPSLGPEALLEATETRQELRAALDALSPTQRQAIVLRYFLDLDVDDVAERLGMAPGTAKWHLHAARKRLGGLLGHLRPGVDSRADAPDPVAQVRPKMDGRR